MLIDTHAHLNFTAFDKDREEVIKRCLEENIWMINIGTNSETSKRAVEIADRYKNGVFATVSLHPINLKTGLVKMKTDDSEGEHFEEKFDFKRYKELTKSKKVVAVGEMGLDYYYKPKTVKKLKLFKEKQKNLFLEELNLAEELNLPVIFHCRMAHEDLLEILNYKLKAINCELKGVIHGFVGNLKQLQEYLKMGFYIGFNGIIFKKIEKINFEKNIENTPLEQMLIETDCPYLTPPPFESERNEPLYLRYIVQKIAKIKKLPSKEVTKITTRNAKELFKI